MAHLSPRPEILRTALEGPFLGPISLSLFNVGSWGDLPSASFPPSRVSPHPSSLHRSCASSPGEPTCLRSQLWLSVPCFLPPQSQDSVHPLRSQGPVPPVLMLSFSSGTAALSCHAPYSWWQCPFRNPSVLSTSPLPPFPIQLLQQNSSLGLSAPVPRFIQPQPALFSKNTYYTTPQLGSMVSQTPPPPGCPP